jgi:hypothetical protein
MGNITARVTGVWFDDLAASPNIQLTWFHNGDIKSAWVRESTIRGLVE